MIFLEYILFFITGLLTKLTDNLVDEKSNFNQSIKYFTGLSYGLLVGYLLSADSAFATLLSAIIIGNLFFGRIDHRAHQMAFVGIFSVIIILGIPSVNVPFLILLGASAWLDEFLNEIGDNMRKKAKLARWFLHYRMTLKITSLAISIYATNPAYFIAIMLFDVSYYFTDKIMHKKRPSDGGSG